MSAAKRPVWGGHLAAAPNELMLRFCAGRDVAPLPMADAELLPFDLWTNRAHAIMLGQQGILSADILSRLLSGLEALQAEWEAGRFQLDPALEDVHVNVERYLTQREGADAGGRLHTARSRNDQVACDMRLYLRSALLELGQAVRELTAAVLEQAESHTDTVMPGFTHHQPAMLTTWGHWLCGFAQALNRDLERIASELASLNRNPLGAAAAFGTSWPINRELTTELMAFDQVERNTLDSISSRWEHEAVTAQVYSILMNHLAVMAQDLILLSHPYWGMARFADAFVTGSSIMPQKRNPDFAEVIKGKSAWLVGMVAGLLAMPKGGMSGYNRDAQFTKYAIMDVVRECQPGPIVMRSALASLQVSREAMLRRTQEGFLEAADLADALARALGVPFRQAYEVVAESVRLSPPVGRLSAEAVAQALQSAGLDPARGKEVLKDLQNPARILAWREHTGSPAPDQVRKQCAAMREELAGHARAAAALQTRVDAAHQRCRDFSTAR